MGKKKKPLTIQNRYVFTSPVTENHISINLGAPEDVRFFIFVGDSSHHFTLTREEATQLARNIFCLLDDEPEVIR